MDFVDLDKVLDEFEEEEKQALCIVPGQELRPSGYLEFLEKHQEQDWALINPNRFSSTSGYTLERRSARETANVAYDDPYDSFSSYKLGFMASNQPSSLSQNSRNVLPQEKTRRSKSAIVTSLTRISTNGDDVSTVYTTTAKFQERKGIANSSERKGTIAYQAIEVQTDALSPGSEQELLSSPFPKTDIIVDDRSDTKVASGETTGPIDENAMGQNPNPIYGGTVMTDITSRGLMHQHLTQQTSDEAETLPNSSSLFNLHLSPANTLLPSSTRLSSTLTSDTHYSQQLFANSPHEVEVLTSSSGQIMEFNTPSVETFDDSVVTMCLQELDEMRIQNVNTSEMLQNSKSFTIDSGQALDIFNRESQSLVEERSVPEPELNNYFAPQLRSWPESHNSRVISASSDNEFYHHDILDSRIFSQPEHQSQLFNNLRLRSIIPYAIPSDDVLLTEPVIGGFAHINSSGRIISYNEPSDTVISHNEPCDRTISHNEPCDRIIYHNEPCDRIISYNEDSDRIISYNEPCDRDVSYIEPSSTSFVASVDKQTMCSSLINGKMEIETILDDMKKIEPVTYNISDYVVEEQRETEDTLDDDVILKQQIMLEMYCPTAQSSESSVLPNSSQIHSNVTDVPESTESKPEETFLSESASNSACLEHTSSCEIDGTVISLEVGARPKDYSVIKNNRPRTLLGLSKVSPDVPAVTKSDATLDMTEASIYNQAEDTSIQFSTCAAQSQKDSCDLLTNAFVLDSQSVSELTLRQDSESMEKSGNSSLIHDFSKPFSHIKADQGDEKLLLKTDGLDTCQVIENQRMKQLTSLNLPVKAEVTARYVNEEDAAFGDISAQAEAAESREGQAAEIKPGSTSSVDSSVPPDYSVVHGSLGLVAPFWIPDADAYSCMNCQRKFTMWKRRHHCRACGKVFCFGCCNQKAVLHYMENKEARVCFECHIQLNLVPSSATIPYYPNPNNPNEYCSKVPPNQQASSHANLPVVLVPTGVLKTSGSQKYFSEPKQVMFSDGIRPGSDLTELEEPPSIQDPVGTTQKQQTFQQMSMLKEDSLTRSHSLIPEDGLPPLVALQNETGCEETAETVNWMDYLTDCKYEEGPLIAYAVNRNLFVGVKIINLDCCMNKVYWCFVTRGMDTAGQSELVVLLELTEEELVDPYLGPPKEIFVHFQTIYEDALKGIIIQEMGHFVFHENNLGNLDSGGFLFLQPTFQCLMKIPLVDCPYLFGILIKKQEVPWARLFPIRLMLRLGAEYRYYPCPLVSKANRKPLFYEIGHTIINLLADFHSYQYMLPQIKRATVCMENKKTVISFPRNGYNDVIKALRNSNEHVMALGSSFSSEVDSHLVCIQSEDGNYQTQAITIQNKPRLVTGASFVVFNGALKSSSGLRAKSSIVEDGLIVQVLPEVLASIKEAMKNMTDYMIQCGPVDADENDGTVELKWVDSTISINNIGTKSNIDGTSLDDVEMINVKYPSDYLVENLAIRWIRVYFLEHENLTSIDLSSVDMRHLVEKIAHACCTALVIHLVELKKEDKVRLGLRVNLIRESIGYDIGTKGQSLPVAMLNDLDTTLIPVIHQASDKGVILEFIFHIVE